MKLIELSLPRNLLPQIPERLLPVFLHGLELAMVTYIKQTVPVNILKPIQHELDWEKVKRIPVGKDYTFICSEDYSIIDGHHRLAAIKNVSPMANVTIYKVNTDISQLLSLAHAFEGSFVKDLGEEYQDQYGRQSAALRGYGHQWEKLRQEIIDRDGGKCVRCGEPANEVDHITPKSRKGKDIKSNLRLLCGKCHRIKTKRFDRRK